MKANDSTSFKTDNDGYIQTWGIVPIVDESMIYDAIDTEKISGRKRTDRLPLPPLPPPIPPVPTVSDYGPTCDPYKKTTVLPNNEEEANKERKRTCKKKHALVILVLLLVVIAIVAISIPIALHIHYTGRLGIVSDEVIGNFTENTSTSLQSTTDSPTTNYSTLVSTSAIETTPTSGTTPVIETSSSKTSAAIETTPTSGTTPVIETTSRMETTSEVIETTLVIETTSMVIETTSTVIDTTLVIETTTSGVGGCTSKIKRCHSCTCSNGRCPVNGQISSSKAYEYGEYDDCDGHCFTEVRKPDGNKTHRGCATSDPKWKSKPESHEIGCHTIQGSYVCFCCGEYCNKDDMTQYYSTACK